MSSRFDLRRIPQLLAAFLLFTAVAHGRTLRVCADPDNLPFSNTRSEGFENRMAELIALNLHATLEYSWWAQRKNFVRDSLNAGKCDLIIGLPAGFPGVMETAPWYRSTYALVYRTGSGRALTSLDDPALEKLRIGVQIVGDAYSPPAQALARRGIVNNVRGYSLFDAPWEIIHAVDRGEIDVAIVWGPFAGYFAGTLAVSPIGAPFNYDIAIAFRPDEAALRDEVQNVLDRERKRISKILDDFKVPRPKEATGWKDSPESSSASASR